MKYFAIGMKTWAEIRESKEPPKAKATSVERVAKVGRFNTPYTLSQITYAGGKPIACVPLGVLRRHGHSLSDGGIIELTAAQAKKFLQREAP